MNPLFLGEALFLLWHHCTSNLANAPSAGAQASASSLTNAGCLGRVGLTVWHVTPKSVRATNTKSPVCPASGRSQELSHLFLHTSVAAASARRAGTGCSPLLRALRGRLFQASVFLRANSSSCPHAQLPAAPAWYHCARFTQATREVSSPRPNATRDASPKAISFNLPGNRSF